MIQQKDVRNVFPSFEELVAIVRQSCVELHCEAFVSKMEHAAVTCNFLVDCVTNATAMVMENALQLVFVNVTKAGLETSATLVHHRSTIWPRIAQFNVFRPLVRTAFAMPPLVLVIVPNMHSVSNAKNASQIIFEQAATRFVSEIQLVRVLVIAIQFWAFASVTIQTLVAIARFARIITFRKANVQRFAPNMKHAMVEESALLKDCVNVIMTRCTMHMIALFNFGLSLHHAF